MGGSKSSKSSSQTTINKDNSAIVEDEGVNISDGSSGVVGKEDSFILAAQGNLNAQEGQQLAIGGGLSNYKGTQLIEVTTLDGEVVERSLDTVNTTVDRAFDFGDSSIDFVENAVSETANIINASTEGIRQLSGKVVDSVIAQSNEARQSASSELIETVSKYGLLTLIGVAAAGSLIVYVTRKKA